MPYEWKFTAVTITAEEMICKKVIHVYLAKLAEQRKKGLCCDGLASK